MLEANTYQNYSRTDHAKKPFRHMSYGVSSSDRDTFYLSMFRCVVGVQGLSIDCCHITLQNVTFVVWVSRIVLCYNFQKHRKGPPG